MGFIQSIFGWIGVFKKSYNPTPIVNSHFGEEQKNVTKVKKVKRLTKCNYKKLKDLTKQHKKSISYLLYWQVHDFEVVCFNDANMLIKRIPVLFDSFMMQRVISSTFNFDHFLLLYRGENINEIPFEVDALSTFLVEQEGYEGTILSSKNGKKYRYLHEMEPRYI